MGLPWSKWAHAHSAFEPGQYTSLALTHVQYHPDDPLAMPLALATLAPPFLLVAYVSTLLVRRELTILVGLIGQLGCEGVNLALKRTFKQGRPTDFLGTGYGMPSSHSQFAGYFAVFWLCHLLRFRPGMARRAAQRRQGAQSKRANNRVWSLIDVIRSAEHYLLISLVLAGCTIVPYSRYHLSYHTAAQIFTGISAGAICALVWYYITEVVARHAALGLQRAPRDMLLDSPLCIALRVRDSWAVWDDGGIEAEYGLWRTQRARLHDAASSISDANKAPTSDTEHMLHALRLADRCDETTTAFSVGCVVTERVSGRVLATGFSREQPGNTHAEEVALNKLSAECARHNTTRTSSVPTVELNLYTTMEPCGERLSKKSPCVERILAFNNAKHVWIAGSNAEPQRLRITSVLQGVREPDDFVQDAAGTKQLLERGGGLTVTAVAPGTNFTKPADAHGQNSDKTPSLSLQPNWLEREAVRLAKKGHADQPAVHDAGEEQVWREVGWLPVTAAMSRDTRLSPAHDVGTTTLRRRTKA